MLAAARDLDYFVVLFTTIDCDGSEVITPVDLVIDGNFYDRLVFLHLPGDYSDRDVELLVVTQLYLCVLEKGCENLVTTRVFKAYCHLDRPVERVAESQRFAGLFTHLDCKLFGFWF